MGDTIGREFGQLMICCGWDYTFAAIAAKLIDEKIARGDNSRLEIESVYELYFDELFDNSPNTESDSLDLYLSMPESYANV